MRLVRKEAGATWARWTRRRACVLDNVWLPPLHEQEEADREQGAGPEQIAQLQGVAQGMWPPLRVLGTRQLS